MYVVIYKRLPYPYILQNTTKRLHPAPLILLPNADYQGPSHKAGNLVLENGQSDVLCRL